MIRIGSLRTTLVQKTTGVGSRWQRYENRSFFTSSQKRSDNQTTILSDTLRQVMRSSAQPVAVITTNLPNSIVQSSSSSKITESTVYAHGATLSSFTTVSLEPPLVAFSLRIPSRLADALSKNEEDRKNEGALAHFVINILSDKQELAADGFSKPGLPPFPLPETWKKASNNDQPALLHNEANLTHHHQPHPFLQMSVKPSSSITKASSHPIIVLSDSIGALSCSIVQRFNLQQNKSRIEGDQQEGGSDLFIARVHSIENLNDSTTKSPLIYWNRRFTTVH